MSREVHVPFCEGLRGKYLGSTYPIINFLRLKELRPYWINSSQNELIKESLTADKMKNVQMLIEGGDMEITYDPHLILRNLKTNDGAFWNLMYTSGYVTSKASDPDDIVVPRYRAVRIPNEEVRQFFEDCVMNWFGNGKGEGFLETFCDALLKGNVEAVEIMLQQVALHSIGIQDVNILTQESFYHGLLLGITLQLKGRYNVESNRQSGFGLYDIGLYPSNPSKDPGVVIEVKTKENVKSALDQIKERQYYDDLTELQCTRIIPYGIRFNKGMAVEVVIADDELTC